jgi:triosephosphate isomerase (TIM)
MMKSLLVGNWKMHGGLEVMQALFDGLVAGSQGNADVEWVVCPSYVYLPMAQDLLFDSGIAWGAQNVSSEHQGAYTGEVSVEMLADYGCAWVIVGHSERRHLFAESHDMVAKKCLQAMSSGLNPIFCVGEKEQEREQGLTEQVIERQLKALLDVVDDKLRLSSLTVAYEPVWAIGTGKTATPEQAEQVHEFIRGILTSYHPMLAQQVRILYGGSVKPDNAKALITQKTIDGFLVGGAALQAGSFCEIGDICSKYS